MRFEFEVPFVRGKARPRVARTTKHMYTPSSTVAAMEEIRHAWRTIAGNAKAPIGRPVRVEITCQRPLPKSRPKSMDFESDLVKPDVDNVAKLVLDALNGFAYQDDSQVVALHVRKTHRIRGIDERTSVAVEWEV